MAEGADLAQALAHYRELAPSYDRSTRLINRIRARTIAALRLSPGETVLDAGCGTGWCLVALLEQVGPSGRVLGVDPSPDMLREARRRVAGSTQERIHLICDTAGQVALPCQPDAILFSYTHDVLRSREALLNLLRQARAGARVAATGTKLYGRWLVPVNWYLRVTHRHYVTNFEGLEAPWSRLAEYLEDFEVRTHPFTQHYIATGKVRAELAAR